jgi:UDP-N-acetylmuramyl pentapeptide phosphotransferase/UDP-N-acetylglucosamine-1-phosphate transferase
MSFSFLPSLPWLAAAFACLVSGATVALILKCRWVGFLDLPNERSLHRVPTPRSGGTGLMAGLLCAGLLTSLMNNSWMWLETSMAATLATVSLLDDRRGLSVSTRLAAHCAVALAYAAYLSHFPDPSVERIRVDQIFWIASVALALVVAINFYNFMDGSNGMAGGMACIGFSAYAWAAWPSHPELALLSMAIVGASAGFLTFNLRGEIFFGDSGSVPLGFLAGAVGFHGAHTGLWPHWFPLVVFAPFLLDAGVTLARRIARGEKFWVAHRQHYYQRVVLMGATHGQLALGEYALMLACASSAVWALGLNGTGRWTIFATIGLCFLLLMRVIDARWRESTSGA